MKPAIRTGSFMGTGASVNVEIGYVPTYVRVAQGSGTLAITEAWLSPAMTFTSGGTAVILPGATIRGATSRATATVKEVLTSAATWSAGTAAGVLILDENSITGTFTAGGENIVVTNLATGAVGTDDATIPAGQPVTTSAAGTAVVTGAAAITRYEGTVAGASKGFTVGGTVAPVGVLCRFTALRENT